MIARLQGNALRGSSDRGQVLMEKPTEPTRTGLRGDRAIRKRSSTTLATQNCLTIYHKSNRIKTFLRFCTEKCI